MNWNGLADIHFVVLERSGIYPERCSCARLGECRRLVRVWRENSEKLHTGMLSQQILQCRLDVYLEVIGNWRPVVAISPAGTPKSLSTVLPSHDPE